jgi:hypothetical protein
MTASLPVRRRKRTASVILGALVLGALELTGASGAGAATLTSTSCPSGNCSPVSTLSADSFGVTLDGQGSAYVSSATGTLRKVSVATGVSTTVVAGLGNLRGVTTDGTGTVWTTDYDGNVQQITASTGAHRVIASGLGALLGATYSGGRLFVGGNDGRLWQVADGNPPKLLAQDLGVVLSLSGDGAGHVYVSSLSAIFQVTIATGHTTTLEAGVYEPNSVQARGGQVYFVSGGGQLSRLDPSTGSDVLLTEFTRSDISNFALDSAGTAYLVDSNPTELWKLTGVIH